MPGAAASPYAPNLNRLLQNFGCDPLGGLDLLPQFNIAPTQDLPFVRHVSGELLRQLSLARRGRISPRGLRIKQSNGGVARWSSFALAAPPERSDKCGC